MDELLANDLLVALDAEPIISARGYHIVDAPAFFTSAMGRNPLQALQP